MQALSQLSYGPTSVDRALTVEGQPRFGSALLILRLPGDQAGKTRSRMSEILTFLPGTICNQRGWSPIRAKLAARFSTDYVAIESETARAGMLGLIHLAASAGDRLHLIAFAMGG